jgi:hypothetical protein
MLAYARFPGIENEYDENEHDGKAEIGTKKFRDPSNESEAHAVEAEFFLWSKGVQTRKCNK